jgi:hypothetical protein
MPQFVFFFVFAAALFAADMPARAETLAGSWSGGGAVHYSDRRERAKCHATFSRVSGTLYRMSASCATPSGRVDQTASVNRVGKNVYAGSFHNKQYNVSGSIQIRLSGSTQHVNLRGSVGGATFKLRRR